MSYLGTQGQEADSAEDEPAARRPGWTRWLRSHRPLVAIATVVVLVGAGLGIYFGTRSPKATSAIEVSTQTVSVAQGTIKETVSASGTIQPAQEADLNFAVPGQVTAVDVTAGQKVTAGQTLASVSPTALNDDLAEAQASLSSAQSKLSTDQADGAAASQIDSDESQVTADQSDVTTAQADVADANLTSTISGTVASVSLSAGQAVSGSGSSANGNGDNGSADNSSADPSSSSSSSSDAQIVVISTSSFVVDSTVDDTEVGQIKAGDQAVITPSGSTSVVYGLVSSVGLLASSSDDVASFPVDITVTGTPSGLYAGSSASVSIIVEQLNNVIEVPTAAITYTTGQPTVTEVEGGRHVTQPITTGVTYEGETQVTSGLAVGAQIQERVIKFNASGTARNLFGGTGAGGTGRTFTGGGGFPGGGGFTGGGGGFTGGAPTGGGTGG